MPKFEVGKVYNWFERGFDPFTVLDRTDKTITVCNGTNTWRMRVRTDDLGEYVIDSSEPKGARDLFTSRPEYVSNDGKIGYGYLVSYRRNGKVVISCMNGYESRDQAERFMEPVVRFLENYYEVLSKAILKDGIVTETI